MAQYLMKRCVVKDGCKEMVSEYMIVTRVLSIHLLKLLKTVCSGNLCTLDHTQKDMNQLLKPCYPG